MVVTQGLGAKSTRRECLSTLTSSMHSAARGTGTPMLTLFADAHGPLAVARRFDSLPVNVNSVMDAQGPHCIVEAATLTSKWSHSYSMDLSVCKDRPVLVYERAQCKHAVAKPQAGCSDGAAACKVALAR
jgi:hypothetical protein